MQLPITGCLALTAAMQKFPGSVKLTCPENQCHIMRRLDNWKYKDLPATGYIYYLYHYIWDKQWKSHRSCLEKFALGRSRRKSDFPEGPSPEGMSDYPKDLPWANFQTIPKAFPLLVRHQASQTEGNVSRRSCLNIFWVSRNVV